MTNTAISVQQASAKAEIAEPSSIRSASSWSGIFEPVPEVDVELQDIEGKIPDGLVGSLYRNGPGQRLYSNSFFDGDGMIRALHFRNDNSIRLQTRFVHTKKFLEEQRHQKQRFRTAGCNLPGGMLKNAFRRPADEANTHVFSHRGNLLAVEEGGHPWLINANSLETFGEEHFDGQLPKTVAFSAHPHYDATTQEIYNFGMSPGKQGMGFQCFKIDKNNRLTLLAKFACTKGSFAHDYALSEKWMVFILPPSAMSLPKFLLGTHSVFDSMSWNNSWGTQIILVPRAGGRATILETDSFSPGHFISAWDEGDDIVIDTNTTADMSFLDEVAQYKRTSWSSFRQLVTSRIRIDTKTLSCQRVVISNLPAEFPRIHPKHECQNSLWAYQAGNTKEGEGGLFKAVHKLNRVTGAVDVYNFGDECVSLEPVFVPDLRAREEDDGWVITYVYDNKTNKTDVVIFNAKCLSDGPLCTIRLPINAGTTFHGTWVQA